MGIASIVLNVLSVVSLPMVLAFSVMTTDSPHTPARWFRILKGILGLHLVAVVASIGVSWWLRSSGRPGLALAASLSPAAWLVIAFAAAAALVDFGGTKRP